MQHVPARDIPIPTTVSPEAQAMLALTAPNASVEHPPLPALDDAAGWRALREVAEATTMQMVGAQALPVSTIEIALHGAVIHVITPDEPPVDAHRVLLYLHGGGFTHGGGDMCRWLGGLSALAYGVRVWAVDYRMPPDHPYPTPLDDCVAAYQRLLQEHRPEDVIIEGPSAGGNLVAAMILKARDKGLPLPAAAMMSSPEADLTEAGDTFHTNLGVDTILTGSLMPSVLLYAGGHDLRDPYLSPVYADFDNGFPPTILTSGTRDLYLSNTVRMHRALRAAGIPAELHVWEAAGHAMFLGNTPEDRDRQAEMRRFAEAHWARSSS